MQGYPKKDTIFEFDYFKGNFVRINVYLQIKVSSIVHS